MELVRKITVAVLAASLSVSANAHRAWLLPAATVLSGESAWVTIDAAVSNDIFHMDWAPLRVDNLVITGPDGAIVSARNPHTGKYRSSFDLELTGKGTYRVAVVNAGLMVSYDEDGQRKRWCGTPERFAQEVPKDAKNLDVVQSTVRIETFITAGSSNADALKPTGNGLELVPITHPNDFFAGEPATFRLLLDGRPASALDVLVIPGGMRYRSEQADIKATTDAEGNFTVTWPGAGMYWLEAALQDSKVTLAQANRRRASYVATLEVLSQ
jgi:uncharacterized GH25 family protein